VSLIGLSAQKAKEAGKSSWRSQTTDLDRIAWLFVWLDYSCSGRIFYVRGISSVQVPTEKYLPEVSELAIGR